MTVREYIGARYVPLYIGEWDDTKAYEPLSIVTYQGDSYTSRQAVPVGIAITNESYWVVSAAFNAQVEQYRQEVVNLSNVLPAENFSSESTVSDALTQNANAIAAVDAKLGTGFTSENTVKDYIDNAVSRKAIYIGNSYTDGYGADSQGIFNLTKHIFDNAWKFTSSGSGFNYGETTFTNLLAQAVNSSSFDNDEITDIIFVCAAGEQMSLAKTHNYNAYQYAVAVDSAMESIYTTIKANFTNIKNINVVLAEAIKTPIIFNSNAYIPYTITQIINNILNTLCNRHDMNYMGWIGWEIDCMPSHFYDDIHPNENGYKVLANAFISSYRGYYKPSKRSTTNTVWGFLTSESRAVLVFETTPTECVMKINLILMNKNDGFTPVSANTWNNLLKIGSLSTSDTPNALIPMPYSGEAYSNYSDYPLSPLAITYDVTQLTSKALPIYFRVYIDANHDIWMQYKIYKDLPQTAETCTDENACIPSFMVIPTPNTL